MRESGSPSSAEYTRKAVLRHQQTPGVAALWLVPLEERIVVGSRATVGMGCFAGRGCLICLGHHLCKTRRHAILQSILGYDCYADQILAINSVKGWCHRPRKTLQLHSSSSASGCIPDVKKSREILNCPPLQTQESTTISAGTAVNSSGQCPPSGSTDQEGPVQEGSDLFPPWPRKGNTAATLKQTAALMGAHHRHQQGRRGPSHPPPASVS